MNEATWLFAQQHRLDDVRQLALQGSREADVDLPAALQQIAGWQTARRKLPSWAETEGLLFPPHLAMEQCSSEQAARYKAQVAASLMASSAPLPASSPLHASSPLPASSSPLPSPSSASVRYVATSSQPHPPSQTAGGALLIDLTGGLGVDFSFLSRQFARAVYVERQEELCLLARHNFSVLGLRHVQVMQGDGAAYLPQMPAATMIFLDPARRDDHGARTYGIADCTPDVLALLPVLLEKCEWLMLKLSPMLDWRKTVLDLGADNVRQVHIVSVGGECKELLLVLSQRHGGPLSLWCQNDDEQFYVADAGDAGESQSPGIQAIGDLLGPEGSPRYLYEPNASLMKAGCFAAIEARFGLSQLAQNSHLFLSQHPLPQFPGRGFSIVGATTMNKKELRKALSGMRQANIAVRNFPMSVAQLRQRLKLSEGGGNYLFATTLASGLHVLVVCRRMSGLSV